MTKPFTSASIFIEWHFDLEFDFFPIETHKRSNCSVVKFSMFSMIIHTKKKREWENGKVKSGFFRWKKTKWFVNLAFFFSTFSVFFLIYIKDFPTVFLSFEQNCFKLQKKNSRLIRTVRSFGNQNQLWMWKRWFFPCLKDKNKWKKNWFSTFSQIDND